MSKIFTPQEIAESLRMCSNPVPCDGCTSIEHKGNCDCADWLKRTAADMIEELAAEVEKLQGELIQRNDELLKLQEENRWIPTSERLPENDHSVLVIVSGRIGNIHLDRAIELAEFSMDEGWILEMWPEWENPTVTHWKPIPKGLEG